MKIKGDRRAFRLGVRQHRAVLDFVTALEDAMNAGALTQQDLAGVIGKSRAWISKVFRRKPNLTFFTAVELADAVGMDVEIALVPRESAISWPSVTTFASGPGRTQAMEVLTLGSLASSATPITVTSVDEFRLAPATVSHPRAEGVA